MTDDTQQISTLSTPSTGIRLPPVQAKVVAALAQGCTISAAAAAAGIHRSTIHIWLRRYSNFRTAVVETRRQVAAAFEDEMLELSTAALKTLRSLLETPDTQPALRLKAALAVLERPRFPNPGWQLGAEIGSPRESRDPDY